MYRCIEYTEAMREEWDALAAKEGTIFHSIAFRDILCRSFGYESLYHGIVDRDGRLQGMLNLLAGRSLSGRRVGVSLPFINYLDFCVSQPKVSAELPQFCAGLKEKHRLQKVELRLKNQHIQDDRWQTVLDNYTFVLPLSGTEEEVLGQAAGSCRNHVRKTYKNRWFTVSFAPEYLPEFYRVYVRRMQQLGSPAPGIEFFQSFFECLPQHAKLLTVLDAGTGRVAGGMLLVCSPGNKTLYYPYGANLVEYNKKYLNNFMYWEAAKFGMSQGLEYLDLGRSQAGSGTYKYKEQWGALPVQLKYLTLGQGSGGTAQRSKLAPLVEVWKRLPGCVTEPLGKRLIKYVLP